MYRRGHNEKNYLQSPQVSECDDCIGLSLRCNFSWILLGNLLNGACQWGMLAVLAKLGSPEIVGRFALALAITAPIMMLMNLHLRAVQATDAKHDYQFGDYISLRLVTAIAAILTFIGISISLGYKMNTALLIIVVGLTKVIDSIADIIYGLLQKHERMDRIALSVMIKGLSSLIVLGSVFYLTHSILLASIGLAVVGIVVLALYDIKNARLIIKLTQQLYLSVLSGGHNFSLRPRWDFRTMCQLTKLSLPLGFVMMMVSLHTSIPRYYVEHFLGERDLGIFAAISYLMIAGITIIGALGQSTTPRLAKYYAEGNIAAFNNLLLKLVGAGALVGIAGLTVVIFAGHWILTILYSPEYASNTQVLLLLTIGAGISFIGSFLGYGITATRAFNHQTIPYLIITIIAVISCYILTSRAGLTGAGWAVCIISLANCIAPIVILIKLNKLRQRI